MNLPVTNIINPPLMEHELKSFIETIRLNGTLQTFTPSQRAALAAELVRLLIVEEEQRSSYKRGAWGRAVRHASALLSVGITSIQRADRVRKVNPEAFEKIKRGEAATWEFDPENPSNRVSVDSVEPKKHQVARIDSPRGKSQAESRKRKMIDGLSLIAGVCHGLESLDVKTIAAVSTGAELFTWADKAVSNSKALRAFAVRLRKGE